LHGRVTDINEVHDMNDDDCVIVCLTKVCLTV